MDHVLKKIDKNENYNELILAYYNFFEKLYGKNLSSLHVKRELSSGQKVSPVYMFVDGNYNFAKKAVDDCEKVYHAMMIGAYDENDGLSAVSRVRFVVDKRVYYACISEIIPTNPKDTSIKTKVIDSFEHYLDENSKVEAISFEVPFYDKELQEYLLDLGYNIALADDTCATRLFEKPIQRDLTHK